MGKQARSARKFIINNLLLAIVMAALLLTGCLPEPPAGDPIPAAPTPIPSPTLPLPTPVATRPIFQPGEMVDYTAQSGDSLPVLALRFNTTVEEIRAANTFIPDSATTMPPGMPMKIPIYYRPLWGTPYQIIPDSLFVNGPAQVGFDTSAFVDSQPGWLKHYTAYAGDENKRGGEVIDYVATNYSVSPRLLLALVEYQTGALSNPAMPEGDRYPLGMRDYHREGLYRQLAGAADMLNKGYYHYRAGNLLDFEHLDGRLERPDPWQNAATVALQHYFSRALDGEAYTRAISSVGFAQTYRTLFGDPWDASIQAHIPGSLAQPEFRLPFLPGYNWAFTGGPHSVWGEEDMPMAALDFAPPSVTGGCAKTTEWATAVADGVISRTGFGIAVLDLDGDGDERTGWVVFYLHLDTTSIPRMGKQMKAGDRIGHPSCDGGKSTGTHVHIARKYNGEWILAEGVLAFNMEGWVAQNGSVPYQGTLYRNGKTVIANTASDSTTFIQSSAPVTTGQ